QEVTAQKPEIEVKLTESDVPNVFVSAFAVRGRIAVPSSKREIDLGKPAFRMGIAQVSVGKIEHSLPVTVSTVQKVYGVRETVRGKIEVTLPEGVKPNWDQMEATLFVVDEGLLSLKANDSIRPLDTFMAPKSLEVQTATSLSQLVGRRHFGLKAKPTGGGGGTAIARELFDTLVNWTPSIPLKRSASGKAEGEFSFKTNDGLSAFRIVAVVTEGAARFGTGQVSFQTQQPLSIIAGIPNQMRVGEKIRSEWTLRNSTAVEKTVQFELKPSWSAAIKKTVKLAPQSSQRVVELLTLPSEPSPALSIEGQMRDESGKTTYDRAVFKPELQAIARWKVVQGQVGNLEDPVALPLAAGTRVDVALLSTFVPSVNGIRDYMSDYPHRCFEQVLSRAVSMNDEKMWNELWKKAAPYMDTSGALQFIRFFPDAKLAGSPFLSSYAFALAQRTGWKIPAEYEEPLEKSLRLFAMGKFTDLRMMGRSDLTLLQLTALRVLSERKSWTPELEEKALSLDLTVPLLPASSLVDIVQLDSPTLLKNERWMKMRNPAIQMLKTRVDFQGSRLQLRSAVNENLSMSFISEDYSMVRYLEWLEGDVKERGAGDLERAYRGMVDRMKGGHLDTTLANAYGAALFRKVVTQGAQASNITGKTTLKVGSVSQTAHWKKNTASELTISSLDHPQGGELNLAHSGTGSPVYQMSV
ncbi:MAG: hypothetical protein EOP09_06540, partial [Proteobacteria bacterium]